MSAKVSIKNIMKYLLNDIADLFPLFFIFYLATLVLSFAFPSWQNYFNWSMFHVNVLILGLLGFLSEHGRKKIFPFLALIKTELTKIFANPTAVFSIIKKSFVSIAKLSIKFAALALDIRQRGAKNYLKFLVLVVVLVCALSGGANIAELLVWIYAFRAIFTGIDSRTSASVAIGLLLGYVTLVTLKQNALAGHLAIFAYYFLIITVITRFIENRHESK